jgi:ribosome-associated protein
MEQTVRVHATTSIPLPSHIARLVEAVQSKQARNPVVLDLRSSTDVADFFLICSADVDVHARAISDAAASALVPDRKPWHVEGAGSLNWVLIDFVDTVVHVFREDARRFYGLEEIWADAPRTEFPD